MDDVSLPWHVRLVDRQGVVIHLVQQDLTFGVDAFCADGQVKRFRLFWIDPVFAEVVYRQ